MTPQHQQSKSNPDTEQAVCDFCCLAEPIWNLECRPFARRALRPGSDVVIVVYRDSQWAACSKCATLARTKSWDALRMRVANIQYRNLAGVSLDQVNNELADTFQHLDQHLTGGFTPFGWSA